MQCFLKEVPIFGQTLDRQEWEEFVLFLLLITPWPLSNAQNKFNSTCQFPAKQTEFTLNISRKKSPSDDSILKASSTDFSSDKCKKQYRPD